MFTLQDISSGELFQKVALAITPKEEQQDFIADICLVYDELAKLSYTQMKLNHFTRTKSVLHPVIEDCFELVLRTILLVGAQNSPHVLVRPSLITVLRSRNHV
jgi:hypothetical protein